LVSIKELYYDARPTKSQDVTNIVYIFYIVCYSKVVSIVFSPSLSMWIHSKFNYASELPAAFFDASFQHGVSIYR